MLNLRQENTLANQRRRALLLAVLAFVLVLVVWQVQALNPLLYPFRFYVTTVHELGHGMTAIITGGEFLHYQVYDSGAGVATTRGGTRWLIIPAGYVGTALFGAVLLYLANRTRITRAITFALGIFFAALTLFFARSLPAILAGFAISAALLALGRWGVLWLNIFALNLLAIITGLNAVLDLWGLLGSLNSQVITGTGGVPNDAYSMAAEIGFLPPALWAMLWIVVAVVLLGSSAWLTFVRPLRQQ
ncbi:MAG: M50 family metallopeptidase [Anaerolineae bacterium]|nr:M50 family metallopeptidase [Anaerolineae bacterium]